MLNVVSSPLEWPMATTIPRGLTMFSAWASCSPPAD
jgi:hypothetical protein